MEKIGNLGKNTLTNMLIILWPNPSKKVGKMAKKVGKKVGRQFSNYNKYVIRPKTKWAEKQKWAGCIPRGCRV